MVVLPYRGIVTYHSHSHDHSHSHSRSHSHAKKVRVFFTLAVINDHRGGFEVRGGGSAAGRMSVGVGGTQVSPSADASVPTASSANSQVQVLAAMMTGPCSRTSPLPTRTMDVTGRHGVSLRFGIWITGGRAQVEYRRGEES